MAGIAIHGFGRIGRSLLKEALKENLWVPVSISDIRDAQSFAQLFRADSNYGLWPEDVSATDDTITIGGREIKYINTSPSLPDWSALDVELVIDCTGRATVRSGAQAHLDKGAERVLVSAAPKTMQDADAVLLPGINLDEFNPKQHHVISMASCTTNALASVVKVMREHFGLQRAFFSTVHAYTNSQALTDQPMKDMRDSWAAAENIIPSSSGAARALQFIWPDLNVTGKAYRVPTRTGSIAELNAVVEKTTSADEIRHAFREAAGKAPLQGVMDVLEGEWASARIVGDTHTSIIDLPLIQVLDGSLASVAAWYDNEMGYSAQLAHTAQYLTKNS